MYQWEISLIGRANTLHVFGSCSIQLFPSAPCSLWQFRLRPCEQAKTGRALLFTSCGRKGPRATAPAPQAEPPPYTLSPSGPWFYFVSSAS